MRRDKKAIFALGVTLILIAGSYVAGTFEVAPPEVVRDTRPHVRSVLALRSMADTSKALITGYNYYLLEKYAEDNGKTVSIELQGRMESFIDSLKTGGVDIVVAPYVDTMQFDSLIVSIPFDSMCVWITHHRDSAWMEELNEWIDSWHSSPDYQELREQYFDVYIPFETRSMEHLSPYDEIIKETADSMGWDWRLLAALIYQESKFHIEARSYKGAMGLMQLMPLIARHYGLDNPLNPRENIRAGASYLKYLARRYRRVSSKPMERCKYVIAAYNAGEGRMDDLLRLARHLGVKTEYWSNVADIIPEMKHNEELKGEVLKNGNFDGRETVHYVKRIFRIYNSFCCITQ